MIGLILLNTLILFTKICYMIYKLSEKINGKWGNKEKKLKSNKLIAKLICALIFIDGKAEEEEKEEAYRYIQEDFREKHQSVMKKWLTQYLKEGEEKIANGTYKKTEHRALSRRHLLRSRRNRSFTFICDPPQNRSRRPLCQ